jgi:hypothetical protein
MNSDPINPVNPAHYLPKCNDGVSCWTAIKSAVGQKGFEDYCVACIYKYLFRFREKGGVTDLKKCQQYLVFLIDSYTSGKGE